MVAITTGQSWGGAAELSHFFVVPGPILRQRGDLAGARPLYERALAIREKVLGPEHPATAQSLNNLAGVLRDQGDLAGTRPLYEGALAIREKVLGPEHPDTHTLCDRLLSVRDLGTLYSRW